MWEMWKKNDLSEYAVLNTQRSVLIDRLLNAGMVTLLISTPLAFGAVHVWAFSLMEMGIFCLIVLWAGHTLLGGSKPLAAQRHGSRHAVLPVVPYLLFLSLVLFQMMPLPPALLQVLSPSTYQLYQTALPGWPQSEPFIDILKITERQSPLVFTATQVQQSSQSSILNPQSSSSWRSLSVYPSASREEILKLLAYGAFFVLVAKKGRPRLLLFALIASGTGLALLAFLQQATWNGKLLWFFVPHDWSGPRLGQEHKLNGPFVNADHLAGYLEMILPLAVVAAFMLGRRLRRQLMTYQDGVPLLWRERLRINRRQIINTVDVLFAPPALLCGLLILSSILILTAVVFTLSRGGFSATFGALFFLAWLLWPVSTSS
jgi:hypothetical protein